MLATSVDMITGTTGNDIINAPTGTLSALDNIDGGAGTDTLRLSDVGSNGLVPFILTTAATIKGVEVLNLLTVSDNSGDEVFADVSAWTGLQTVNVTIQGEDAPVGVFTNGNVTSATVTGATTSVISDDATTNTLASVTVVESTDLATIESDALTSLTLKSSTGGATVDAATATRALTVNLDGVTAGTVTDNEATSLTVNATGTKSSGVTLAAAKATAVTVNAAVATTIADVIIDAAKSLTVSGAGATTVTATTTVTALTSIDASGSTGGLTVTPAIGTGVAFTGSAAADVVTVVATTKAIAMGAGHDKVTMNAVSALGTGGSIDAGEGTDTLVFNTYANAVTASGTTTFAATIRGFERLELSGANAAAAAVVNLANLDDINHVTLSATNTQTTTISNMGANGTIVFKADQTTALPVTVSLKDATGTTDVLNVDLSKATATALVGLTAAGVETVNVTSTETATKLLGTVTHGVEALVIADATALKISGNAGVTITTLTGTKLASIDASGVTTGLVSFTTGALTTAANIKGGAGANNIVASAATKAVTYTGQDKVDTITIDNALNNVVTTGGGDDVIVTGSGADVIDAGAGADTITSGTGLDQITGGAGADTFNIVASANGNIFATIKDASAGDKLSFTLAGTETFATAKLTLGGTAVFHDYLNLAASGTGANLNGAISWFQFGGNTYVVADTSASGSFVHGTDMVVELTGLINMATATGAGTNVITLV